VGEAGQDSSAKESGRRTEICRKEGLAARVTAAEAVIFGKRAQTDRTCLYDGQNRGVLWVFINPDTFSR